jgi:hypothetical protein
LLSGIARCGLCGMGMVGLINQKYRHLYKYACRSVESGGCAKVAISGPKLDLQIEKLVTGYLANRTVAATAEPWAGQARLDEVSTKIAELMEQYRQGLSGGIVFPMVRQLEDEQRQLQTNRARHVRTQRRTTTTITGEWSELETEAQRAIITSVLEAVVIKPQGRRGVYDPNRVEPIWC